MEVKSEDSDVIVVGIVPIPQITKRVVKGRNVFVCKQRSREKIICQTFTNHKRRREFVIRRGKEKISFSTNDGAAIERIVPCCQRRMCKKREHITRHRCVTPPRSKKKINVKKRRCRRKCNKNGNTSVNNNMYENISSDSFHSDSDVDELIRSTRKRMKAQYNEWSTNIMHKSTPLEDDLDSTVELNSIHSLDTVVIKNVDDFCWPITKNITDSNYSPVLSPISLQNIKVETNNNDVDNINYSPSMEIEDLKIDIKPLMIDNNYDYEWSPISDDYLPNVKREV